MAARIGPVSQRPYDTVSRGGPHGHRGLRGGNRLHDGRLASRGRRADDEADARLNMIWAGTELTPHFFAECPNAVGETKRDRWRNHI